MHFFFLPLLGSQPQAFMPRQKEGGKKGGRDREPAPFLCTHLACRHLLCRAFSISRHENLLFFSLRWKNRGSSLKEASNFAFDLSFVVVGLLRSSRFPFSLSLSFGLVAAYAPVSRSVDKIGKGELPLEAKLCRSYRS